MVVGAVSTAGEFAPRHATFLICTSQLPHRAARVSTHDTTDYPEVFQTVETQAELRRRHYEVEVDEDVIIVL